MAKVFVSYSRKDIEFAKRLTAELQKSDLDFWIDWEGIPPTVDWWREIEKGIEEADVFLFLISSDSSASKVCGKEIDCAVKNAKRIIPLVVREIKGDEAPQQLSHLNWIFFREGDDFDAALKKLMTAIQTDYEWAATHRRLQVKALDWERNGRENGFLLRGTDLLDAEQDLATNTSKDPHPTDLQREFVFESRKATDRQKGILMGVSIAGVIVLATLTVVAVIMATRATEQAQIALDRQLTAQTISLYDNDFDLSLLLSAEVYNLHNTFESKNLLLQTTQQHPHLEKFLPAHSNKIYSLAFTEKGETLIVGENDSHLQFTGIQNTENVNTIDLSGQPTNFAFAPKTEILFALLKDGTISAVDLSQSTETTLTSINLEQLSGAAEILAVNANGNLLVVTSKDNSDSRVTLWDLTDPTQPSLIGSPLIIIGGIRSLSLSPDGHMLATGNNDGTITLWKITTSKLPNPTNIHFAMDENKEGYSLAFSSNGAILISGTDKGRINLWDVSNPSTPNPIATLTGSSSAVSSLALKPNNKTLVSGSDDGNLIVWDVSGFTGVNTSITPFLPGFTDQVSTVTISSDGTTLATGSVTGAVNLWDISDFSVAKLISATQADAWSSVSLIGISSNGKQTAWGYANGSNSITKNNFTITQSIAVSPDGNVSVVAEDRTIRIIACQVDTSCPTYFIPYSDALKIKQIIISHDNKLLAFIGPDELIHLWDISDLANSNAGNSIGTFPANSDSPLVFHPDNQILAVGVEVGKIQLWNIHDASKPTMIVQSETGHNSTISALTFSSDGEKLASGASDGTIMLWEVSDPTQLEPFTNPLATANYPVLTLAFASNNKDLIGSSKNAIFFWDTNVDSWLTYVCQRAGRNLSEKEWGSLFGDDQTYQPVCDASRQSLENIQPLKIQSLVTPTLDKLAASPMPSLSCPNWLVFDATRNGDVDLFRIDNAEGTAQSSLYNLSKSLGRDTNLSRSPDNKWVVFQSNRDGNLELYLSDSKGQQQTRLTHTNANNINPMFGPDSQTIVYQSDRNGSWDIFTLNKNTGEEMQLTSDPADDINPFYSPEENWIVFQSNRTVTSNVYILDMSTGTEYQITSFSTDALNPSWSPNGKSLAFFVNLTGTWDLYVSDIQGLNYEQISTGNPESPTDGNVSNMDWSPDGNLLAYQQTINNNTDIYVYNIETSETSRLTTSPVPDINPSWDCSGNYVSFTSYRNGNANILFIPWSGGEAYNITTDYQDESRPIWSP